MPPSINYLLGIHSVTATLQHHPHRIKTLYLQADRRDKRLDTLRALADKHNICYQKISKAELDSKVTGKHQGVVASVHSDSGVAHEKDLNTLLDQCQQPPFLLILDGITDPHNLGACLRSADAAGVDAVITPKDNAVGLNATVHKVACGAAETVPFIQVSNLARTMKALQQRGVWLYGTADDAGQSLYSADLRGAIALVMGAEGKGMRRLTREHCDYLVSLPMAGNVSSLNVSVATGVCLFEVVRQRLL